MPLALLYPRTYNLTIYQRSSFDMIIRFKVRTSAEGVVPVVYADVDVSDNDFVCQFYDLRGQELLATSQITRPDDFSIEIYLTAEQTEQFLSNGLYDLKIIYPNGREYFILSGKFNLKRGFSDN